MSEPDAGRGLRSAEVKLQQRLEYIEFRLFWTGRLNRADLAEKFRISTPQTSLDIKQYQDLAPGNADYDKALKYYVRLPGFEPRLIGRTIDRYLQQVVGVAQGWLELEDSWFPTLPTVDVVSLDRPRTDASVLLKIQDAVRNAQEIEIDYSSMTGSPASRRSVAPHAMGWAWGRWYVRAWAAEHKDFRDYALARISGVGKSKPRTIDPRLDHEWQHVIDLVLVPNPKLPPERRRAVELEHRMVDGRRLVSCRLSMAFYLNAEHKLDVEPGVLDPLSQQLVLEDPDQIRKVREVVRALSIQALKRASDAE